MSYIEDEDLNQHEDFCASLASFKEKFTKALKYKYGIVPSDCTSDELIEQAFNEGQSPQEYVDYLGEKYELNEIDRNF